MADPLVPAEPDQGRPTRMLFLGDESLADGFRLIGFETFPDPPVSEVDRIFRELQRGKEDAFVIVDDRIMQSSAPELAAVRSEGGRIVVVAVPALKAPPRLSSDVADRVQRMFGNSEGTGEGHR
jgi:vacuolar-type H+-ATPase subunit F/Vma7